MLFENRRSSLAVRNLVPLCVLALFTAPIPAPFSLIPAARAQNQLWITQFGTSGWDIGRALAPDREGGVMIAGSTWGSLGGPFAGGYHDAFLARFDGAGNQLWIRQFGTSESDVAYGLTPDGAGGVLVAGYTSGSLGGPQLGSGDAFLARYDSAGNRLWIRQFGTSGYEYALALTRDGAGGVMIAGGTTGDMGGPNTGGVDVFLARHDSLGNQLWVRQFGTKNGDGAGAVASDGAGGVFVGGSEGGVAHAGSTQAFLARYDGAGNQLWIRRFGTVGDDSVNALTPDGAGGVMVAGGTGGGLSGYGDAYVARYDGAGNQLWIHHFGTSGGDIALALAPDGAGGMMVAGLTQGDLGGPNSGGSDVFVAHYDSAGNRLWIGQFGTSERDWVHALATDGAKGVMLAGWTEGSLGGPSAGSRDVFLARYEIDSCYADCDQSGVLDIFDFLCFQNSFVLSEPYACDCDPDPVCDIFDFLCFQNAFVAGCP